MTIRKRKSILFCSGGNVLVSLLIIVAITGVLLVSMTQWISRGQSSSTQDLFFTEADNYFDLVQALVSSPTACNANFTNLNLVMSTPPPLQATITQAPAAGVNLTQLVDMQNNPAIQVGVTYGPLLVQQLTLFDVGPAGINGIFHQAGLYFQAKNKNGIQIYRRIVYFWVVSQPGPAVTECSVGGTVGNITAAGVVPVPATPGVTGSILMVQYSSGYSVDWGTVGTADYGFGSGTITGAGCVPSVVVPTAPFYSFSFESPTATPVTYTQGVDPTSGLLNNCISGPSGPLNWNYYAYAGYAPL